MAQETHDWEIRFSKSRQRPYFYSIQTKKSCWDPPSELTAEQIEQLPGANLLHGAVTSQGLGGAISTNANANDQENKIRASHILIKHAGSRRPSSWKEATITRTKEEARAIITELEKELKAIIDSSTDGGEETKPMILSKKLGELATIHSDCSSHTHGGDLGYFSKNQMQKPFEDVAFSLPIGHLSHIVDTESGLHLILRTA